MQANEVAVVVTDLNLSACSSGLDLARWIKEQQPRLSERIILLTGADAPEVGKLSCEVLTKPVNMEALLKRVTQLAQGEAAGCRAHEILCSESSMRGYLAESLGTIWLPISEHGADGEQDPLHDGDDGLDGFEAAFVEGIAEVSGGGIEARGSRGGQEECAAEMGVS